MQRSRVGPGVLVLSALGLLVASLSGLVWFGFRDIRAARATVARSDAVLTTIDNLEIALRDAETGQRGYLLTGRPEYLEPYKDALSRISGLRARLAQRTAGSPEEQAAVHRLGPVIAAKLDELDRTIALRRAGGLQAALPLVETQLGFRLMGRIETALGALRDEERAAFADRSAQLDAVESRVRLLAVGAAALAFLLFGMSTLIVRRAQKRLVRSEAEQRVLALQLHTAFHSITQGLGIFGPDGKLARANHCFGVLLCIDPRPGDAYAAIASEAAAAAGGAFLEPPDVVWDNVQSGAPADSTVYERTRASDRRSFEITRTLMSGGGFVLTVAETTARVQAQAVAGETQRLQAIGHLTGGIAHDFNNLLTVILGNLELVRPQLGTLGSSVHARIDRAIWGVQRGATLTRQLLAFARRQPLAPSAIDLADMLPDMESLLRRTLGEQIDVAVASGAGLWPALADRAQLESAILNLALNARDAMPEGGRLTIEGANTVLDEEYCRRHDEVSPGEYLMLAVTDSGTGMTPAVLARAFEPFFTTKEVGRGTGLGLSMVFGFVKQSDGHVTIYSEPGEGTTIRLYLPRASSAVPIAHDTAGAQREPPHGEATVLIVEDQMPVRQVAVEILTGLGYRVLQARDGQDALAVFSSAPQSVDLLLTDVVMPGGMKGDEVARKLREIRPSLRVLFMSGYPENALLQRGRVPEGAHLIGKPFSREELARSVAEVLAAG